jgi:PEP-CTERM motif
MKFGTWFVGMALCASAVAVQAQSLPIVGGTTSVRLTSAPTLVGAGFGVGGVGSAVLSPGSDAIPVAHFGITGGGINTATFAGSIEHAGSGLSLTLGSTTLSLQNFVIDTIGLKLSGDASFGATTLDDVALFDLTPSGNLGYPVKLSLSATGAGALTAVFGIADLTGLEIGLASTTPITSAVPEPTSLALLLAGFGVVALQMRRRLPQRG